MTSIQCEVQPDAFDLFEPGKTAKLAFSYTNHNENGTHHVRSISLSPTWNLNTEISYQVDVEIGPSETVSLRQLELELPAAIGGRQGFLIHVEVRDRSTETGPYERVAMDSISRMNVHNTARYRALVCGANDTEFTPIIRQLLGNWGFDIQRVDSHQEVVYNFMERDSQPACVVGIISALHDSHHQTSLVASSAATSLDHERSALIFVSGKIEPPDLPYRAFCVPVDSANPIQLEKDAGPLLLTIRELKRTGTNVQFFKYLKTQTRKKPQELVNDWANDNILSLIKKGAGVAGAYTVGRATGDQRGRARESVTMDSGGVTEQWTMDGYDSAHTRCPYGTGPIPPVREHWSFPTGYGASSPTVVVDGGLYFGDYYEYGDSLCAIVGE